MKTLLLAAIIIAGVLFLGIYPSVAQSNIVNTTTWSKTFEASANGIGYGESIIQTSDGGYAVIVDTSQVGSHWGGLLVKLNSEGNVQWTKTLTLDNDTSPTAFVQAADGGYAIVGTSINNDSSVRSIWFVKIGVQGNIQWTKLYGSSFISEARALTQTNDGGYAIVGDYGSNTTGGWDALLLKTDSDGNAMWNKTYGGPNDERFYAVVQTADSGYAMGGNEGAPNGNKQQFWLVKTDASGTMEWNRTFTQTPFSGGDYANSMVQTNDGGYALAGFTDGGYARSYTEYGSFLLVKTNSSGIMQWEKMIGVWSRGATHVIQASDGGYLLTGQANLGDRLSPGIQFQLAKTNSTGGIEWTYSETDKNALSVVQTNDAGFALSGVGNSNNIFWVAKLDSDGNCSSLFDTPTMIQLPTQTSSPSLAPTETPSSTPTASTLTPSPTQTPNTPNAAQTQPSAIISPSPTIPEFPSSIILPIIALATLAALAYVKKIRKQK